GISVGGSVNGAAAAAPAPRLSLPRRLVAVAEAGDQGALSLDDRVAPQQIVRLVVTGIEVLLAVVVVEEALDEPAAAEAFGLALPRDGDLQIDRVSLADSRWDLARYQDQRGGRRCQDLLHLFHALLAELVLEHGAVH